LLTSLAENRKTTLQFQNYLLSFRDSHQENRQNKSCRHFTRMNALLPFPEGTRDGAPQEFAGQNRSFPPR
jgi:hypothetical protein